MAACPEEVVHAYMRENSMPFPGEDQNRVKVDTGYGLIFKFEDLQMLVSKLDGEAYDAGMDGGTMKRRIMGSACCVLTCVGITVLIACVEGDFIFFDSHPIPNIGLGADMNGVYVKFSDKDDLCKYIQRRFFLKCHAMGIEELQYDYCMISMKMPLALVPPGVSLARKFDGTVTAKEHTGSNVLYRYNDPVGWVLCKIKKVIENNGGRSKKYNAVLQDGDGTMRDVRLTKDDYGFTSGKKWVLLGSKRNRATDKVVDKDVESSRKQADKETKGGDSSSQTKKVKTSAKKTGK
jgi:hypothetical protein